MNQNPFNRPGSPRGTTTRRWSAVFFIILNSSLILRFAPSALAFPPAPDVRVYGMVKDQLGTPLTASKDKVILQTPGGLKAVGSIQPGLAIGVNYLVNVPMDAGTFSSSYKANALVTSTQYKLYVVHNGATNLPIEMTAAYNTLGLPASYTLQNLTLGTATNGTAIPDQWLTVFFGEIGVPKPAVINPNKDYAHDGRSLLQEYQLGNYPFNPADNFSVRIVNQSAGSATLAFTTMTGRSYTAYGSADLQTWTPLNFTMPGTSAGPLSTYYAPTIAPVQIQTVQPTNAPTMQFFKLQLQ
jgi:hypothetical protein